MDVVSGEGRRIARRMGVAFVRPPADVVEGAVESPQEAVRTLTRCDDRMARLNKRTRDTGPDGAGGSR